MWIRLLILFFVFSIYRVEAAPTPVAEYHFDETQWFSTIPQQMLDSGPNDLHGKTGPAANTVAGKLCNAGSFDLNADTELTQQAGVTVTASSTAAGYSTAKVIDLSPGIGWNAGGPSGWVQVDLGAVYLLSRIELYGSASFPETFNLHVSNDGVTWTLISSSSYQSNPSLTYASTISSYGAIYDIVAGTLPRPTQARYVRYTNTHATQWAYSTEIAIWGSKYATVPNAAALQVTSSYTIASWVKTTSGGGNIFLKYTNTTGYPGYSFSIDPAGGSGKLSLMSGNGTAWAWNTSNGPAINDGQWHHVAAVVNGTQLRFYVDGVQNGTAITMPAATAVSTADALIGFTTNPILIDELLVFNSALTASDIAAGYANYLAGKNWNGTNASCTPPPISWLGPNSGAGGYEINHNGNKVNVQVTGPIFGFASMPTIYLPAITFANLTPNYVFQMQTAGTVTINFDKPVKDPHIAFYSMGTPSTAMTYTFSNSYDIVSVGVNGSFLNYYSCVPSGTSLVGKECNGVIRFNGVYRTLSFTTTAENWNGFNIGISDVTTLLGHYRFEESSWNGTAGELKDVSDNNQNGQAIGAAPFPTSATVNPAIPNGGTCGYAELNGPSTGGGAFQVTGLPVSITKGDKTTVSFWMHWNGIADVIPIGWDKYNLFLNGYYLGFRATATGSNDLFGTSSTALMKGWNHIVAVFNNGDSSANELYVNGVKKVISAIWGSTDNTLTYVNNTLTIGGWGSTTNYRYSGKIDEVKVFKGGVSSLDVSELHTERHSCETGIKPTLVAQYRFEDTTVWNGTAGELKDTSRYDPTPSDGKAVGTGSPTKTNTSPALSGTSGTCSYANFPGASGTTNAPSFQVDNLAINTAAGNTAGFSLWVYWAGAGGNNTVLGWSNYELVILSNGSLGFNTYGDAAFHYVSGLNLQANRWYHIAVNITAETPSLNEIYIDGVKQALAISNGPIITSKATTTTTMRVGSWTGGVYTFQGRMDELKVFSGRLSATDVALLKAEKHDCASTGAKLLAQYHFEEKVWTGATSELNDSSGNGRDAKAIGSPLPTPGVTNPAKKSSDGKSGTCGYANFAGPWTGGGAFEGSGLSLLNNAGAITSISFWMYWDGTNQVVPIGGSSRYDIALYNGYIGFNTGNFGDLYGTPIPSDLKNSWHHIVGVFVNGATQQSKLYIDGVLKNLSQVIGMPDNNYAYLGSTLRIGGWNSSTAPNDYRFSGRIDEVNIYSGELTQSEVNALFNATHTCPPSENTTATLIAEYHLEDTQWTGVAGEVKDSSGNGLHGKTQGSPLPQLTTVSPAKTGSSGTCGYASLAGPASNGGSIVLSALPTDTTTQGAQTTVSLWMYWNGANAVIAGWKRYALHLNNTLSIGGVVTNRLYFSTDQFDYFGLEIPVANLANAWHHLVIVFTNTDIAQNRIYIDGVAQTLTRLSDNAQWTAESFVTNQLTIGGRQIDTNGRLIGNVDEVKVFNGVVTPEQVKNLYEERHSCGAAPIAAYHFEDVAYTGAANELQDSSGNNRHGKAAGSGLPSVDFAAPAKPGITGTCGYANLPGPTTGGGTFVMNSLPVSVVAGDKTTVSLWLYWNGTDTVMPIGWNIYSLFIYNGKIGFGTGNGGDVYGIAISSLPTGLANAWHHIVAVFNNGDVTKNQLYIDGAKQTLSQVQGTPSASGAYVTSTLQIPGWQLTTNYRSIGRVDEVKVFNYEVTPSQVNDLFNEVHNCTGDPIAEYHFENTVWNGTAGELTDSAKYPGGPFNGTAIGSPRPIMNTTTPARAGTCGYATFSGPYEGGGAFDIDKLPVLTTAGAKTSVSFWMRWTGNLSTMPIGWYGHDLLFTSSDLGNGNVFGFNGGGSDLWGMSANAFSGTNAGWHHIVAVFTNGDVTKNKIYVDGNNQALSKQRSFNMGNATVSPDFRIGGWRAGAGNIWDPRYRFIGDLDELKIFNKELSPSEVRALYNETHACSATTHHLRIEHYGSGVTCTPSKVTISVCGGADAAGGCTPDTSGMSGNLIARSLDGTALASVPFNIPAGRTYVTLDMPITTAQTVIFTTDNLSRTTAGPTTCWIGNDADCRHKFYDSGFIFTINDHISDVLQNFTVSAVKKADNSLSCVPALKGIKTLNFKCSYINPNTGTVPVRIGGVVLNSGGIPANACDATGNTIGLSFDDTGVASTDLQYADVGKVMLTATYTSNSGNDGGLYMDGQDDFVAAPKAFSIAINPIAPDTRLVAGKNFSVQVSAINNSNAIVKNFGKESSPETATLNNHQMEPTEDFAKSATGSALSSFDSAGLATATYNWSNVGKLKFEANLTSGNYLNSGLSVTGNSTSNAFFPDHFDVAVTPGCSTGSFTYSGQPFGLTVTAKSADGVTTTNYDKNNTNYGKEVTLSDANNVTVGSFQALDTPIAATAFVAGIANTNPTYTFTAANSPTTPRRIRPRVSNADLVSSSTGSEAEADIYSGRARLYNANGVTSLDLPTKLRFEYFDASAKWAINTQDTCTINTLNNSNFAFHFPTGTTTPNNLSACDSRLMPLNTTPNANHEYTLTLTKPGINNFGWTDMTLNLSPAALGAEYNRCTAVGGAGGAEAFANKTWLQFKWKGSNTPINPSARMTFGAGNPSKVIHMREVH